jgi:hypothetical protein
MEEIYNIKYTTFKNEFDCTMPEITLVWKFPPNDARVKDKPVKTTKSMECMVSLSLLKIRANEYKTVPVTRITIK